MTSILVKFLLCKKTSIMFLVKDDILMPFAPKKTATRKRFDKFLMFSEMRS